MFLKIIDDIKAYKVSSITIIQALSKYNQCIFLSDNQLVKIGKLQKI
jgi:hypothetical protein